MTIALWLLTALGLLGAFDTVYYHEWRARLPARGLAVASELKVHALRDFLYALLFATLPWIAWHGWWVVPLALVMVAEIVLTMIDFVVEIRVRKSFGDVVAGERITHTVMGIFYGAMVANLLPVIASWWSMPTALAVRATDVPEILCWSLTVMSAGVFLSGMRDLYAAYGLPHGGWPWMRSGATP